ncbi:hypothetical protein ACJMK2_041593, partial [Sinanodonta woodiana]
MSKLYVLALKARASLCTPGDSLPDPDNCGSYYHCTFSRTVIKNNCPIDKVFSRTKKRCVSKGSSFDDCSIASKTVDSLCTPGDSHPDPFDCQSYYHCTLRQNVIKKDCPADKVFSKSKKRCVTRGSTFDDCSLDYHQPTDYPIVTDVGNLTFLRFHSIATDYPIVTDYPTDYPVVTDMDYHKPKKYSTDYWKPKTYSTYYRKPRTYSTSYPTNYPVVTEVDYHKPKKYPTDHHKPKKYPTDHHKPKEYPTDYHKPKEYPTNHKPKEYPTDHKPKEYPTDYHKPKEYPTGHDKPKEYPTNHHKPKVYPTDHHKPKEYPTGHDKPKEYPTDHKPKEYPTDYHKPKEYPTDYHKPKEYPTYHKPNEYPTDHKPKEYPTDYHKPKVYPTDYHKPKVYPTDYNKPKKYPGGYHKPKGYPTDYPVVTEEDYYPESSEYPTDYPVVTEVDYPIVTDYPTDYPLVTDYSLVTDIVTTHECMNGKKFSDPDDCRAFYLCRFGILVRRNCPHGLHFRKSSGTCVPEDGTDDSCVETSKKDCVPGQTERNHYNCSSYYACNDERFQLKYCPIGQVYSSNKKSCVKQYGYYDDCSTQCRHGQKVPYPTNCHKFFACSNGILEERDCRHGKVFSISKKRCVKVNGPNDDCNKRIIRRTTADIVATSIPIRIKSTGGVPITSAVIDVKAIVNSSST